MTRMEPELWPNPTCSCPSVFEGTPLTLMEAMHGDLPVVSTNVCGMRDVIKDRQNGLLVPVRSPEAIASAIGLLDNDAVLRESIGRAAKTDALALYLAAVRPPRLGCVPEPMKIAF